MISTCCPGSTRPTSVRACRAVSAETGTTAACSKERLRRLAGELVLPGRGVLGEGAAADPEHLVAWRRTWSPPSRPRRPCRRRRARAPGSSACGTRRRGGAGTAGPPSGARCRGPDRPRARVPAPRCRRPRAMRSAQGAGRRRSRTRPARWPASCLPAASECSRHWRPGCLAFRSHEVFLSSGQPVALAVLSTARYRTKYK